MATAVIPSQGTTLEVGTITLKQVTDIDGPGFSVTSVPTTHLTSDIKSYRPGMCDPETISGSGFLSAADHGAVLTKVVAAPSAQTIDSCTLTYPDGTTFEFEGFFTKFEPNGVGEDTNVGYAFEVKLSGTGSITFTPPGP